MTKLYLSHRSKVYRLTTKLAAKLGAEDADFVSRAVEALMFRADTSFSDYEPYFLAEGPFPLRFLRWIRNVKRPAEQAALIYLADEILYLDSRAVKSLYAEAYRRHICPWMLTGTLEPSVELSPRYWAAAEEALASTIIYSVTESFHWDYFRSVNGISGIPEPKPLGKTQRQIVATLAGKEFVGAHIIIMEDVVGSGDQAIRALQHVVDRCDDDTSVLFLALVAVEGACERIAESFGKKVDVRAISVVHESACIRPKPGSIPETRAHQLIRALVRSTEARVLTRLGDRDEQPRSPFGYRGTGATLVMYRNTPNNTLPLIHHRAPEWAPLFRRIHHQGRKT